MQVLNEPVAHLIGSCYIVPLRMVPMTRKPNDPIALQVRMTEGLRHKLAKSAEENGRSLNAEILWRLEQTFSKQGSTLWRRPLNWSPEAKEQVKEMVEEILGEREKKKKEER